MNPFLASSLWCRVTAWTVTVAMLLPTVVACTDADAVCATRHRPPRRHRRRRHPAGAGEREAGLAVVVRSGVREEAYAGMTLQPGDRIDTGPRADAVLRYASGTELVLRPNSGGRIGSLTDFVGEVFVKVKGFFSVDTTFVKAGARGTAYLVRTHAGGHDVGGRHRGHRRRRFDDRRLADGAAERRNDGARAPARAAADASQRRRPRPHARLGRARGTAGSAAERRLALRAHRDRLRGCHRGGDPAEPQQGLGPRRSSRHVVHSRRNRHARHASAAAVAPPPPPREPQPVSDRPRAAATTTDCGRASAPRRSGRRDLEIRARRPVRVVARRPSARRGRAARPGSTASRGSRARRRRGAPRAAASRRRRRRCWRGAAPPSRPAASPWPGRSTFFGLTMSARR